MGISAVASLIVTAYGTYQSAEAAKEGKQQAQKAAEEQRKQAELERKRSDIQNARTLRAGLRQSRIAAAATENAGANTGTSGSSGVAGGLASIGAQTGANVGTTVQQGEISNAMFQSQTAMADISAAAGASKAKGAQGSMIAGMGQQAFSDAGGYKKIFGMMGI